MASSLREMPGPSLYIQHLSSTSQILTFPRGIASARESESMKQVTDSAASDQIQLENGPYLDCLAAIIACYDIPLSPMTANHPYVVEAVAPHFPDTTLLSLDAKRMLVIQGIDALVAFEDEYLDIMFEGADVSLNTRDTVMIVVGSFADLDRDQQGRRWMWHHLQHTITWFMPDDYVDLLIWYLCISLARLGDALKDRVLDLYEDEEEFL